jgi:hypothetical protein
MMADNIEHVISYWVVFQKFHSPALAGFAVLSHWLPFLLFSVASGVLADRFDPRRLIQCGMGLFILASLGWGYLLWWLWRCDRRRLRPEQGIVALNSGTARRRAHRGFYFLDGTFSRSGDCLVVRTRDGKAWARGWTNSEPRQQIVSRLPGRHPIRWRLPPFF